MIFLKRLSVTLLPGIIFLLFWEWSVHGSERSQFLFASPSAIVQMGLSEAAHAAIWADCLTTLGEALLGLLFGTLLGTLCGLLLWGNGKIDRVARPYIVILGSIPVFALAPIMIIWFGIGLLSKAIMAGLAVFFVSLIQSYEGAHATARQHLVFARSIGASHGRAVIKVVIPGSIRWVVTGFRMNVGFSLMGAFIAEFVSSEAGLGHYILKASSLYDMPRVLFGLLLLSLMAVVLTSAATFLQEFLNKQDSALHREEAKETFAIPPQ